MLRHQNCGRAKIGRRLPLYRVNFARRNTSSGTNERNYDANGNLTLLPAQ